MSATPPHYKEFDGEQYSLYSWSPVEKAAQGILDMLPPAWGKRVVQAEGVWAVYVRRNRVEVPA
jgi:hypothetical protein